MLEKEVRDVLTASRTFINRMLQVDISTHETCEKLMALKGLPESDEQYAANRKEANTFMRKRQAKTQRLIDRIDKILK